MARLVPVEDGESGHLIAIIDGKRDPRRTRLRRLQLSILDRYQHYATTTRAFDSLVASAITGNDADDCADCYAVDRKPVARLRQAILEVQPMPRATYCQWCMIDTWSELDHYAPVESFPEYSVMARNLTPCCSRCNALKHDYWPNPGELPEVLSLYYDDLLDRPHLSARIHHTQGLPTEIEFSIAANRGLSQPEINRLSAHYTRLGLLARFRDVGIAALAEYREALRAHCVPREDAVLHLRAVSQGLIASYGPNYYKALTALALSECEPALDEYVA